MDRPGIRREKTGGQENDSWDFRQNFPGQGIGLFFPPGIPGLPQKLAYFQVLIAGNRLAMPE
jgi:hypothetical protein